MDSSIDGGPLLRYRALVASGKLKPDPVQELTAEKLQSLYMALTGYRRSVGAPSWRERLGLARRQSTAAPQGLYLCGSVGRGKSMLMDLFYAEAPLIQKRRTHFHAFMLEVHDRLHVWRRQAASDSQARDPIATVASELAGQTTLLCFDEFQVTNIADAMILGRLLQGLLDLGVVIVATSNAAPDDLYAGGLQRELFLPTIALIKDQLDVLALDGTVDYRRARIRGLKVYHTPADSAAKSALIAAFSRLTDGEVGAPDRIEVQGRTLEIRRAARGVAWSSFPELCERALGPADYLKLASRYHTLILEGIPLLSPERRNEARRFVTLIDALYEHRTKLIASAAAAPDRLYPAGDHAGEFLRTASRLIEMEGIDYLDRPHLS